MQQEDFIKIQIDRIGRVLGKILADLIDLKIQGKISEGVMLADQALKSELDLDINNLLLIPTEKFIKTLQENKKLSNEAFDKLAEIIFNLAESADRDIENETRRKLFERSLLIYKHLEKASSTYSMDRYFKMEKMKNAI
jgi:hypothetical protein